MKAKFLVIGDINGKIARRALAEVLPLWKKKIKPDYVIANGENIAHGSGVTRKTLEEVRVLGIDLFTSGNHIFKKPEANEILTDDDPYLLRPDNFPAGSPGRGIKIANIGEKKVLVVNLQGQVFMEEQVNNPFLAFDKIYEQYQEAVDAIIVDLHCEATSEKVAFGWHIANRAEALWGTHTHVPTADERIINDRMAYITDVGMVGERDSVIGVKKDIILKTFITGEKESHDIAEKGWAVVNGITFTIDLDNRKAISIERLNAEVEIS